MSNKADTTGNSPIWATIGKLGAFVSLVIAIFTLYAQLNPDKANVTATCQVVDVISRPKQAQDSNIPPVANSPQARNGGKSTKEPVEENTLATKRPLAAQLLEGLFSTTPQFFLQCEVGNKGRQEAKDVVIDLPVEPKAATGNGRLLSLADPAEKSISLGTLRPNGKLDVVVWFESYAGFSARREDTYSLSFSGGVGSVQLMHPTYGWIASVAGFLEFVSLNPFILLFAIAPLAVTALPVLGRAFVPKEGLNLKEKSLVNSTLQSETTAAADSAPELVAPTRTSVPRLSDPEPSARMKEDWRD